MGRERVGREGGGFRGRPTVVGSQEQELGVNGNKRSRFCSIGLAQTDLENEVLQG